MLKLYSEKDVVTLVKRLKEEYDGALRSHREKEAALTEENRDLCARVAELEGERSGALAAFAAAEREREKIKHEGAQTVEGERRELALLIQKCRRMLDMLRTKYPDEEDTAAFSAFCNELGISPAAEEESGFDLEEVTSPKGPLDLGKLCRELGLMEDDE